MDTCLLAKSFSIFAAAVIFAVTSQPFFVGGYTTPTLKIEQTEVAEENIGSLISVDVSISNNTDGFLATSFGIQYDPSLVLVDVQEEGFIGRAHYSAANTETGLIWFSGASGNVEDSVSESEEVIFTLTFALPSDAAVGNSYPISFVWTDMTGMQGCWYLPDRCNIFGNIQSMAQNGGITIPDPSAPFLSETDLRVSTGGQQSLTVENFDGDIIWFSDNSQIASVENGVVTGLTAGACTVYALCNGVPLTCAVSVTEEAYYDISQTPTIYIRDPDKKVILQCPTIEETNSAEWISSNVSVCTVENGVVTGLQNGAASIYAICSGQVYSTIVIVEFDTDTNGNGDVNQDETVDIMDVILLNRNLLGAFELSNSQELAADAYQDGAVTSMDSLVIMRSIVDLEDSLPIQP